jgi:hypothetical protein
VLRSVGLAGAGLFLYALLGFGSAPLLASKYRGWELIALSPALGLTIVTIVGTALVTTGTWSAAGAVFWLLVVVSTCIHLTTLMSAFRRSLRRRNRPPGEPSSVTVPRHYFLPFALAVPTAGALGLLLCLASAFAVRHLAPGRNGLLGAIPLPWYLGLLIMIAAVAFAQRLSAGVAGAQVLLLALALTLTPAIVYDDPRYSWTAKHVGVTSYILLHGSVNSKVDIYQAWPGLFAAVAWICKIAAMTVPMEVARWWPPVIDLATIVVFRQLAALVLGDPRRAWLATAVFLLGNTIGQDYYSPQAADYLIAIAIFAVVFRHRNDQCRMSANRWVLLGVMSIAAALTHQLTPYMVAGPLICLAISGYTRTRWAAAVTLLPAIAWAVLHLSYVKEYFRLNELGNVANVLTTGTARRGLSPYFLIQVNRVLLAGDALLIGLVALVVIMSRLNRLHLTLGLCAASGAGLLLATDYGNEGDFRVVLFALPWLAVLAADAGHRSVLGRHVVPSFAPALRSLWWLGLPVLLVSYVGADMGLDDINAMRPGDVLAVEVFEEKAPVGSVLIAIGNGYAPLRVTGRYNVVNEELYPYVEGLGQGVPNPAAAYERFAHLVEMAAQRSGRPYFVLACQQAASEMNAVGLSTVEEYWSFVSEFGRSGEWTLVLRTATSDLFRFVPPTDEQR